MRRLLRSGLLAMILLGVLAVSSRAQPQPPAHLALLPVRTEAERALAQRPEIRPLALITRAGEEWLAAAVSAAAPGDAVDLGPVAAAGDLYLVDEEKALAAGHAPADVQALAQPLWQEPPYALVQLLPEDAAILAQRGVRLIPLQGAIRPFAQPAALPPPPAAPDPGIAALLAALSPAEIATWDRRLSGEETVIIGGVARTLPSRYSWSTHGRRSEQYVYERLQALGYSPRYHSYSNPPDGATWRNIIIDIPGQTEPERVVLLVGHLDSISDNNPGLTAPGADDNGSGSAALLTMAELLRGQRLRHTLRLVWFTGEEFGYWGSRPYVAQLVAQQADVVAAINLDMIGYDSNDDRVIEVHTGTRGQDVLLGDHLAAANQLYQLGLALERKTATATRFSDHRSFWDNGYTAVLVIENFFDGTDEDPRPRDRNPQYHKTGDKVGLVDFAYVTAIARMGLAAALHLAQPLAGTETPTSTPTATVTPTATPTSTPLPSACVELISNGGFEQNLGWTFTATATTAGYTTQLAHSGVRSARLGVVGGMQMAGPRAWGLDGRFAPAAASYSTALQSITLPATAASITLRFWYNPGTEDSSGDNQAVWLLAANTSYPPRARLLTVLENDRVWKERAFDLTAYAGESLRLYFQVYNDDVAAQRTWMFVDDISLLACPPATATPTVTPTPTPSPTATLTPSPTATETSTVTPAATATETSTITPTATETSTITPTATATETSTITPTATETSTVTPAATATETSTITPTATETSTITPTATETSTITPTATETSTATLTPSPTPTATPTPLAEQNARSHPLSAPDPGVAAEITPPPRLLPNPLGKLRRTPTKKLLQAVHPLPSEIVKNLNNELNQVIIAKPFPFVPIHSRSPR